MPAATDRVLAAVEAIYDTAPNPSLWPSALGKIADCFDDAYLNHPFHKEFLVKHGLGWFGGVGVSPDPRIAVALSVQRNFAKPQFSDAELDLVATLGRHVEKSLRLSIRLLDTELANLGLGDALARIGIGVFALDWSARVLFANPVGKSFLGEAFDLVNDHLLVRVAASRAPFETAMTQTLRAEARDLLAEPKPILVGPTATGRRFVIYLLPITASAFSGRDFLTHTRAIVLAIEQKSAEPPDPAVVRDILGLTLGEARIAALVGSGIPPKQAASRLGIAEDTARNVLKRVFEKLDISRQSELAVLLGQLVLW